MALLYSAIGRFSAIGLTAAFWLLIGAVSVVRAQDVCVTCTGPDQTYLCSVEMPAGLTAGQPAQLYCIYRLAKEGTHESCAASRTPSGSCIGVARGFVYDGPTLAGAAPILSPPPLTGQSSSQAAAQDTATPVGATSPAGASDPATGATIATVEAEPDAEAAKPKRKREPRTMVELTDQAVKQSAKQLKEAAGAVKSAAEETGEVVSGAAEKTGSAVGRAAKGAFECITSLFSRCN